jgi:hypothetical protein
VLNFKHEMGKPIKGFEPYYVISTHGRVSNYRKIMKTYILNTGYLAIKFTVKMERTTHLIHRLVAEAFIPNPNNYKEVNHIDGNKLNNHVSNLQWVSSSMNKQHAIKTGLFNYVNPTTGKKLGKSSNFHNVSFDRSRNKFVASIRHNKKTYFQKRFNDELDAARHVNWILDELGINDRPRNNV